MKNYKAGKYIYYVHPYKRAIYKCDVYIIINEEWIGYLCENIGRTYLFTSTVIDSRYRRKTVIHKWEVDDFKSLEEIWLV